MTELSPTEVGLLSILLTFTIAAGAIACGICAARHAAKDEDSSGKKPLWLSSISTFAGGVLLAAALTHLLNDTVEDEALQELSATIGVAAAGLSLSLHSVIAGVALGASNDVIVQYDLLLAVLAHKGLAAFSLTLLATRLHAAARNTLLAVFVCSTPLGIGIGLGVSAAAADSSTVVPLIISFAAGTIAYTGAFEIILPELGPGHGGGAAEGEGGHSHELLMLAAFSSQPLEAFKLPGLSARTRRRDAHMQAQYGSGKNARALSMDSVMMEGHFPEEYTSPALPKRSRGGSTTVGASTSFPSGPCGAEHLDLSSVALLGNAPGSPMQGGAVLRATPHSSPLVLGASAPAAPPSPLALRASQSATHPAVADRTNHRNSSGSLNGSGGSDEGGAERRVKGGSNRDADGSSPPKPRPQSAASRLCALMVKVFSMVTGFVFMSVLAIWA